MTTSENMQRRTLFALLIIMLVSIGVKLYAAQLLVWEVDYVPVIARGQAWLAGGAFPSVGTLSSVAAYNMPFLVWLQIPAMLITRDVATILIFTQLTLNLLATWMVYRLGSELFTPLIGLMGATLFTFSETGISSAYTAWAQLLLPAFYVMVIYCLVRWKRDNRVIYVALTWIVATAGFMTHFSAVLLYGVIVVLGVLIRLPLNWRGITLGLLVSAVMLMPYMTFEVGRDFVDLKAFFTRQTTIPREVLDEYAYLKPENQPRPTDAQPASRPTDSPAPSSPAEPPRTPSRLERGIAWVLSLPLQVIDGLRLLFATDYRSLREYSPTFHTIAIILKTLLEVLFWVGAVLAIYRYIHLWRTLIATLPEAQRTLTQRLKLASATLTDTPAGWYIVLLLFILGIIAGLIVVRASPDQQATYYTGIFSIQWVLCAYGITQLSALRGYRGRVFVLVFLFVGLGAFDRIVRVANHDMTEYSPFNVALYSTIHNATRWIADDWQGDEQVTVSYDVMPEMAGQWWVVPWHTVDETYRMGMAYDYLLETYHGLRNTNHNPLGLADNPDYIITYPSGLNRYEQSDYQVQRLGALVILKPLRP